MAAEEKDTPAARSRPPSLADQIKEQIGRGNLAQACTLLESYVREKPHRSAERYLLGSLLHSLGRIDAAIRALEHCVALAPKNGEAQFLLGRLRHQIGQPVAAELPSRQAIATRPGWPKPIVVLGSVLVTLERWHEALDVLRTAIAMRPRAPRPRYHLGLALVALNCPQEAEHHFAEANRLQPDWVDPWLARAKILGTGLGEPALDWHRQDADACLLSALIEFDTLHLDAAIATHWRAAALDPGRVEILFLLARCLAKLKRFEESAAVYARSAELMPDRPDSYFGMGNAALKMGDAGTALLAFQKVIELDPNIAPSRFGYAMALMDRGNESEARRQFAAAAKQDSANYGQLARFGGQGTGGAMRELTVHGRSQGVPCVTPGTSKLGAYLFADAALLGSLPIAIASDGTLLANGVGYSAVAVGQQSIGNAKIVLVTGRQRYLMAADRIDHVAGTHVFLGAYTNFGHWLYNNVSRLVQIERSPQLANLPLAVPDSITTKQRDLLALAGYGPAHLTTFDAVALVRFERLWIPLSPWQHPARESELGMSPEVPQALASIAARIDPQPRGRGTERVYIPRGAVGRRRLLNEADVIARLERLGFTIFDPMQLSILEQIRRIRRAGLIVGPFGAAMPIISFARPGSVLIECKAPNIPMDVNPFLCAEIGIAYVPIIGVRAYVTDQLLFDDFSVPMPALMQAVESALRQAP